LFRETSFGETSFGEMSFGETLFRERAFGEPAYIIPFFTASDKNGNMTFSFGFIEISEVEKYYNTKKLLLLKIQPI
jgi:hypothetical protein